MSVKPFKISPGAYGLLPFFAQGSWTTKALMNATGLSRCAVNLRLNQLIQAGIVEKRPFFRDLRIPVYTLARDKVFSACGVYNGKMEEM